MPEFDFATAALLEVVDPDYSDPIMADDPIFRFFPMRSVQAPSVVWDIENNTLGLQKFRGFNAPPLPASRVGATRHRVTPGVYGEFQRVDEEEMTNRAAWGSWATPIGINDLIAASARQTMTRQIQRMSWLLWTLCTKGQYVVLDEVGAVVEYAAIQFLSIASAVPWTAPATATPLADFRAIKTYSRGTGASFGGTAQAFMNQTTASAMLNNSNADDLGGRKTRLGASVSGLGQANEVLSLDDAPTTMVYDQGYFDDSGTFLTWIPDGVVVLFGQRSDQMTIGEFQLTTNLVNGSVSSLPYYRVIRRGMDENSAPPPSVEVHRGFNGAPAVKYPSNILIMKVF